MKVYLHGSPGRPPGETMILTVNPAVHLKGKGELPADWVDDSNRGREFTVEFKHGVAEVEDDLGKYMVSNGLAHKTRLLLAGYFNG